jgi:PPOX class probable F420-dependent enzyme
MLTDNDNKTYDIGDTTKRKITTSVEIVDAPPSAGLTAGYDEKKVLVTDNLQAGTTKLNKEDLYHLFQFRNLAFLSTLSKDGSPHITPVWAEMVDELIIINTFEASAKNRNISNDKRVAISIVEQNNPFNMVSIQGKVIERTTKGADEHLKSLAKKYLGIGKYYYRKPNHQRIIIKVQPEKTMGLSIHPAFYFLAYSPWNKK